MMRAVDVQHEHTAPKWGNARPNKVNVSFRRRYDTEEWLCYEILMIGNGGPRR